MIQINSIQLLPEFGTNLQNPSPSPIPIQFNWDRWYLPEKMDTINVQIKLQIPLDLDSPGMNVIFDGYTILQDIRKWFSVLQPEL